MRCHDLRFAVAVEIAGSNKCRIVPGSPAKWPCGIVCSIRRRNESAVAIASQQRNAVVIQIIDRNVDLSIAVEIGCDDAFRTRADIVNSSRGECAVAVTLQDHYLSSAKLYN